MDTAAVDSFSVSSISQSIERRHFGTSFVWKIAQLKRRISGPSNKIVSPLFQCSNAFWQLALCGNSNAVHGAVTHVYLQLNCIKHSFLNFNVYVKCVVLDQNNLYEVTDIKLPFDTSHLSQNIIGLSMKAESVLNTSMLTINFSIIMEEDSTPTFPLKEAKKVCTDETKPGSCLNLLSRDLEELYNSAQFSDVTLKSGEEEFKAHKSMLSARSKVFAAMFEHDMRENLLDTVDLLQMEVETVSDMLRYIYCGRVRELSPEEALNLYVAADRYDLKQLRTFCREVILLDISANNVCDIAQIAELHNDQLLIRELKSFLLENSKELIKTVKWKTMCAKNPVLCCKMFEWIFIE